MSFKLSVNGYSYEVKLADYPPDVTLNIFLREHLQLTATKYMCLEGGCGACICVLRRRNPANGQVISRAANSCLTLLNTCADVEIITNEGLGNTRDGYHPIQKRLTMLNGSQCGFCSPGFVMNMYGLLESKGGQVSMQEVEDAFGGNICRCTGYRPILDAMKSFANDSTIAVPNGCVDIEDTFQTICPRSGQCLSGVCHKSIKNKSYYVDDIQWHYPQTLPELFEKLHLIGFGEEYMLIAGNTAHGVYRRSRNIRHFIYVNYIPELQQHSIDSEQLLLGANMTLSDTMIVFLEAAQKSGFEYCKELWEHFNLIANLPVRNNGTIAGNISTKKAHPDFPSDVFITLVTLDAVVTVLVDNLREEQMSLISFLEDQRDKLVLKSFHLKPYPKEKYLFKSYKILPRAQNASAYVNAGFLIEFEPGTHIVCLARICFGGIRPDFVHATQAEAFLVGRDLYDPATIAGVFNVLSTTLMPTDILPQALAEYRKQLACGLFYKFLLSSAPIDIVNSRFRSGGSLLKRPLSSGSQKFETIPKNYPVTQAVEKLEGIIQCSGEAIYMNDIQTTANAVYCAFVNATKVGANIEEIDPSAALALKGVVAFYSAKDIRGFNAFNGSTFLAPDPEEIFCVSKVKYYDQPLGVIAALSHDIAVYAATLVRVTYSTINGPNYFAMESVLSNKVKERIVEFTENHVSCDKQDDLSTISADGIFELGSQYHFTIEPQTTIAVPSERGMQIYTSTQWTDLSQKVIADMLKLSINKVQLDVRRVGGSFGAKMTRGNQVACAASLVAYILNRPARFVQTIESMMSCNGKRYACRSDYGFKTLPNGLIVSARNTYFEDAGCSLNENPVSFLTLPAVKNAYNLNDANFKVSGNSVVTDAASSSFCRAPGTLEGISMTENMLEHVAFECRLDPADVRLVNLRPGNKLIELLPRFIQSTEYRTRRQEIDVFNTQNRWKKRGIGFSLMEFPISTDDAVVYPTTVAIYHYDGSVVISHGGIEMGQGINTKVAQVAAFILKVPLALIRVVSTNTLNGANSMLSANGISSESVCVAVRKACNTLLQRLEPARKKLPKNADWQLIVDTAWKDSVNLIASDGSKREDVPNYSVFGLALTELDVDLLTGNHIIRRVDILEDAGESLSPNIDVGQVEGAFIMGLGYFFHEKLVYNRQNGQLLTNRTWNYHPPGAKDIPVDFRIELLQKSPNPVGFMRSKSTGEPATCLSVSALFAMQHALQSARDDAGMPRQWIRLGAPTTPETVMLNAAIDIHSFSLK